jgi:hypothetical protein
VIAAEPELEVAAPEMVEEESQAETVPGSWFIWLVFKYLTIVNPLKFINGNGCCRSRG